MKTQGITQAKTSGRSPGYPTLFTALQYFQDYVHTSPNQDHVLSFWKCQKRCHYVAFYSLTINQIVNGRIY